MGPKARNGTPGPAPSSSRSPSPGALVDQFLARCSSEERGRLIFKVSTLAIADSNEARSVKKEIIAMYRHKLRSADPEQHKKISMRTPSPEEIMEQRMREEAQQVENLEAPAHSHNVEDNDDPEERAKTCRQFWKKLGKIVFRSNRRLYARIDKVVHDAIGSKAGENDVNVSDRYNGPEGLYVSLYLFFEGRYILLEKAEWVEMVSIVVEEVRKGLPHGDRYTYKEVRRICLARFQQES